MKDFIWTEVWYSRNEIDPLVIDPKDELACEECGSVFSDFNGIVA